MPWIVVVPSSSAGIDGDYFDVTHASPANGGSTPTYGTPFVQPDATPVGVLAAASVVDTPLASPDYDFGGASIVNATLFRVTVDVGPIFLKDYGPLDAGYAIEVPEGVSYIFGYRDGWSSYLYVAPQGVSIATLKLEMWKGNEVLYTGANNGLQDCIDAYGLAARATLELAPNDFWTGFVGCEERS